MGQMKVGALGALNVDIIIHGTAPSNPRKLRSWVEASEITFLTAGAIDYFSQSFAKLGCDIHFVSVIADDPFGQSIISSLKKGKIRTDHILIESNTESGVGVYILLFGSRKHPMTYRPPTHHAWPLHLTPAATRYLLDTDLIHCGGYLHFPDLWNGEVAILLAKARKRGLVTSLDPQSPFSPLDPPWLRVLKPVLSHTDILFINENEVLGISGVDTLEDATKILTGIGVSRIAVKLGEKGCLVLDEGKWIHQPAIKPARFVDSIGAGDSFDVGFLYGILRGYKTQQAAKLATFTASRTIEGVGVTNFPKREELI
nr:carbohydrate kinase family protein [Candidatus Njordarchaeota archaeon]